jgi:asparagine synthase (glutamine-hydrolysing)
LAVDASGAWHTVRWGEFALAYVGYIFNGDADVLLAKVVEAPPKAQAAALTAAVASLDGNFAIAATGPDWCLAAVDRVRSIPLFLGRVDGEWTVDNRAERLRRAAGLGVADVDPDAALAIAMAGYTIDRATLYRGLLMPGPGECLVARGNGAPEIHRYHTYRPWRVVETDEETLRCRLADVTLAVMEKHLASLGGRPLAIPLSAGNDSRLVASAARHLGYRDIRCFAYGQPDNFEAKASRAIAERLGVPWAFAPMSIGAQRRFFAGSPYSAYLDYADSCASVPFVQDMSAIEALKTSGFIPDDAVIANGNSGDFITGNHIPVKLCNAPRGLDEMQRRARIVDALANKHFALWMSLRTEANIARIRALLTQAIAGIRLGEPETDHGLYEYAEFQDRQCKYVISGQRIYEFLGHDWRLPLWDNDYLDFWEAVPLRFKAGQKLYNEMLREANWGGVWKEIPVNRKGIRPRWLVPLRLAAKAAHGPLGAERWHRFERRVFQYWMDATCNSACVPYKSVLFDNRGSRHGVAWQAEAYLARHGLALDQGGAVRNA